MRRKALLLPAVLLAVTIPTAAASAQQPKSTRFQERSWPAVQQDIKDGKAMKLTPPGQEKRFIAAWTGCKFVYLTEDVVEYRFDDGSVAMVVDNGEPMPPKDPGCVERNPTREELIASDDVLEARNAKHRPPGSENRPRPPRPPR